MTEHEQYHEQTIALLSRAGELLQNIAVISNAMLVVFSVMTDLIRDEIKSAQLTAQLVGA
ncbi:MAG: hypothetical protein ACQ9ET_04965 [Nitrosomonadaceae bacterium]